ncbi:hypothetical protein DV736_g6120, partial [Chaetothyriales sp. CBS 134916]
MLSSASTPELCDDDCRPHELSTQLGVWAALSTLPFVATFALVTLVAYRRVYPLLHGPYRPTARDGDMKDLPLPATAVHEPARQTLVRRLAALTFSCTIALSAVLTELLLCEISNSFNPTARSLALQTTITSLLGLLVVAIPILGIHAVVSSADPRPKSARLQKRVRWGLEMISYAGFLLAFWSLGLLLPPSSHPRTVSTAPSSHTLNLFQACLDRLGITGVTLMALLSGFASVSAIWQAFGPKVREVSEAEIARKQAGCDATLESIAEKRAKLISLGTRFASEAPAQGFWSKAIGSFRGSAQTQERQMLEMEINGLETIAYSLESSLSLLRSRLSEQRRRASRLGRVYALLSSTFAVYCVYRIITTTGSIAHRMAHPHHTRTNYIDTTKPDSDPITNTIALIARLVYPSLDQAAWAQQSSFLISGIMLVLSFSAVTRTSHLFARFMPSALHSLTRTNFALLISQISGMYVISSALMLRSMMPARVGVVINSALGGSGLLEPGWVQRWFDGVFMAAVILTTTGIAASRYLGGASADDDEPGPMWGTHNDHYSDIVSIKNS